ncbi:uncharacterized protein LOC124153742 isoform X1 [Ischnura elegans]|uniref:uncharacterized protein LOC124153742 isoform X1 n=1 Tax=Ischnura elegans TaxID=197161 RepID=UPI001ED8A8B4|nr:uncharacterized protein LOC124153742 isoform X1 [Ischnura elegans]XP_046383038.1 uncharacterized protein LOC124153742 isoform X1 [Ischnura elegans]XP_046383039.1 uncharacterized protein LOC124153742 isoform X1 [Ischnura elegans]
MMAPQQFCVRWNSHQSNLQSAFPKLLTNEHFADVTLACEARSIRCHKVVLSACSAYFESLLVSNPCQHPIVFMKDMRHRDLRALVDFMYRGEVNVSQEELASLLRAAEALQIRGLSGSDQEVAAAPIGSLPTNLPPDISVRNGPIVPSTGQESPPPGSGNGRRSLHKRRRNLGQGGPGSPSGGDSQRSGQRDDGRASDDDVEAVDEEAESPRPRTHGEIQVRGDLHEPSGIDEEGKDEYEEDGGVDLDTVKTEHDYGSQALDNSGAAAGDNEDDLEEEDEEEGESLKIEGDGRPSDPQSMHYHHMLDVPGPSGYTPQTHTPSQEKMMMGAGFSSDAHHPAVPNDVKEPAISIHEPSQRKRIRRSRESAVDELQYIPSETVPLAAENKIERLKHFVNTYELGFKPGASDADYKGTTSSASWSNEKHLPVNPQGNMISLLSQNSEGVSRALPPPWFSIWAEKKEKSDRYFQEDMRDMLDAILRKLPQEAQQTAQPEKKPGGSVHGFLPLKTMLEFKTFNERLCEESDFKQSFVNFLNSIRATNTKQAMVGSFGKCMDDELMCNFTWAGHTRSKSELQSTPIAKCIVDVVRNMRSLNNPPLAECLKYGSEAVRYANQRRNQWRSARGRGQLQFKQPPAVHEVELVERPDDIEIEERIEQPGSDQDRYGVFMTSGALPPSVLPHSSSVSITSHPAVPQFALPPHSSVQPYSQALKRKVQPLTVVPWAIQERASYQQGKVTVAHTITATSSVAAHSSKRPHTSGANPVPHSSATIPEAHQSSKVPSNSSRSNT